MESTQRSAGLLWQIGLKHYRLIVACTLIAGLTAFLLTLALPKTYQAEVTILPRKSGGNLSSLIGLSGAESLLPLGGMLGSGKNEDLAEILSSRSMAERVIEKLNLGKAISGWQTHEELVEMVRKAVNIVPATIKVKVITIQVEAKEAALAANIANAYAEELKLFLDELGYSDASKNRKFIERQLSRTKQDLAASEKALAEFQSTNRLVSLPDAAKAAIETLSDLEAKRIETETKASAYAGMASFLANKVDALQADPNKLIEIEVQQNALKEQDAAIRKAQREFQAALSGLPPKGLELGRLQRDVQIQNAIYLTLTQQYEVALISEAKDSDAFFILDNAFAANKPIKPSKKINTALGLMLGFVTGTGLALLRSGHGLATPGIPNTFSPIET